MKPILLKDAGIRILLSFILTLAIASFGWAQGHAKNLNHDAKKDMENAIHVKDIELAFKSGYLLADQYSGLHQYDKAAQSYALLAAFASEQRRDSFYFAAKHAESFIYYYSNQYESCLAICEEILKGSNVPSTYLSGAHLIQARVLTNLHRYEEAKFKVMDALKLFASDNDSIRIGESYRTLGDILKDQSKPKEAITYYLNAIEYLKGANDYLVINVYYSLLLMYLDQNNLYKSLEYSNKIQKMADLVPYPKHIHKYNCLHASVLRKLGRFEEAQLLLEDALNYFVENNHDELKSVAFRELLAESLRQKDLMRSLTLLDSISKYTSYFKSNTNWFSYYIRKCQVLQLNNEWTPSKIALDSSYMFLIDSEKIRDKSIWHNNMYQYYKNTNDDSKALLHLEICEIYKDSIFKLDQTMALTEIESKYLKADQDKIILELNNQKAISEYQIKQQTMSLQFSLIGLLLLSMLSYFIYHLYTKLKIQNKAIQTAYVEKDILLREIHHRVKNNLQVISSLLALQSKYVKDDNALDALKQGQDRVYSMALIHQDLYQSDNLTGVDSKDYFEHLIDNLFDSYNIDEENISLELDIEPIVLDVDTMIPLGLVMNELVSNSLKHAFKNKAEGKINVRLSRTEDCLFLKVSDNGKGIKGIYELEDNSFGYELIKAFALKLKAEIKIDSESGLSIELKIKNFKLAA